MRPIHSITHAIARRIPGAVANTAQAKRALEKQLRAAGYSRTEAKTEVRMRFNDGRD